MPVDPRSQSIALCFNSESLSRPGTQSIVTEPELKISSYCDLVSILWQTNAVFKQLQNFNDMLDIQGFKLLVKVKI